MKQVRKRLTYANAMSSIAVFLVLGGATAVAASKIGSKELKANAVTAGKIKKNAVTTAKIKKNAVTTAKIKNNAVNGAKINEGTLGTVPSANTAAVAGTFNGYSRKTLRATATSGGSEGAAREAAPELTLFAVGPFTIYAKCIAYGTTVKAIGFIKTTENGSIFDGDQDDLAGDPFLDTNTAETDREIEYNDVSSANEASYFGVHSPEFVAMAPNGTVIRGDMQLAVKNGDLPGGNGIYGAGNVCLLAGEVTQLNL